MSLPSRAWSLNPPHRRGGVQSANWHRTGCRRLLDDRSRFASHTRSTAMKLYRYRPVPGGLNAPIKSTSYIGELSRTWRDLPIDLISRSPIARWAPIPLRLIVGYGFMEHGFAKLARGPEAFPAIFHALGVPAPHLLGWLTILVEIVAAWLRSLVRWCRWPAYRWRRSSWSPRLLCIFPTGSARSSFRL
jgi:hypothetical protein